MTEPEQYRAREHYQDSSVAADYDDIRFKSWMGRISHATEEKALTRMVDRYFGKAGSVLDLPCGTGRLLSVFLDRGFEVLGGDISDEMIGIARKRFAGTAAISFQKMDAEKLPLKDNSVDYVTSYRLMCHLPDDARFRVLQEMMRVVRKCAVINYHFDSFAPLALFNRTFRKTAYLTYPLRDRDLRRDIELMNFKVLDIKRLSWYERSSALVVIQKER